MMPLLSERNRGLWIRIALGASFYLVSAWFVWDALQASNGNAFWARLSSSAAALAFLFWLVARALTAAAWALMICPEERKGRSLAWCVFALSAPGKYVPGKFLTLVARAAAARALNVTLGHVLAASAMELLLAVAMAMLVGLTLYASVHHPVALALGLPLLAFSTFAICRAPPFIISFVPRRFQELLGLNRLMASRTLWAAMLLSSLSTGCLAVGSIVWMGFLDDTLTASSLAVLAGGYLFALGFSAVVFFAPAGLGAREAAMYPWLDGMVPDSTVSLALLSMRVLDVMADLAFTALGAAGFVVCKRSVPEKPAS